MCPVIYFNADPARGLLEYLQKDLEINVEVLERMQGIKAKDEIQFIELLNTNNIHRHVISNTGKAIIVRPQFRAVVKARRCKMKGIGSFQPEYRS